MTDMTLSQELTWRGLIKDRTFQDITWLDTPKSFYLGADVGSSDSLTIGNLAIYLLARRLLDAGWKTVMLVGGATSLIGDPGGKEDERQLVSREQVEFNKKGIRTQVENLFAGKDFTMVDNYDWFKDMGYLEFLREAGKHYSVSELVQRDYIADRMGEGGSGISYAEFSYSLIQGYDFWHLFREHGVQMQIGGSDQWGNMLSGVPLIRKKENAEAHALSIPLVIDKTTGRKFGKSEGGAVWLDAAKTSPYKFYQFWLNVDDAGVEDYLKIYTFLSKEQIESIMAEFNQNHGGRGAQKTLAYEVTKIVHGAEQADRQVRIAQALFGERHISELDDNDIAAVREETPYMNVTAGVAVIDVLVETGLVGSKSEARRLLEAKAIYVNGTQIAKDSLDAEDFQNGRLLLRRGKAFKDTALIEM